MVRDSIKKKTGLYIQKGFTNLEDPEDWSGKRHFSRFEGYVGGFPDGKPGRCLARPFTMGWTGLHPMTLLEWQPKY